MPGLTRVVTRSVRRVRRNGDHGGVAALVAVLLASGTLLGVTAFSVDLGTMYSERAQLISGANAAAMVMAQNCGRAGAVCFSGDSRTRAQTAANTNAFDGAMSVDQVCGRSFTTSQQVACAPPAGFGTHCTNAVRAGTNFIEVYAGTRTPDGANILPPSFAGSFLPGYSGGHLQACSRVVWGIPAGPYAAFGYSSCEFGNIVNRSGGKPRTAMPAPWPNPIAGILDTVLKLEGQPTRDDNCGDLGYLDPDTGCQINQLNRGADLDGLSDRNPSNPPNVPNLAACRQLLNSLMPPQATNPRPYLLIPIYDVAHPNRNPTDVTYRDVLGIAAFQVTGYKLDDTNYVSWRTGVSRSTFCGGGTNLHSRCLRGYFVSANIIDGTWPKQNWNDNYGLSVFHTDG